MEDHWLFGAGLVLMGAFAGLDFIMRVRMTSIGVRKVWLLGGAWNYSEYLKACAHHGWSKWIFYMAMIFLFGGLACFAFCAYLTS